MTRATMRAPSGLVVMTDPESLLRWIRQRPGSHIGQLRGIARIRPEWAGAIGRAIEMARAAMRERKEGGA